MIHTRISSELWCGLFDSTFSPASQNREIGLWSSCNPAHTCRQLMRFVYPTFTLSGLRGLATIPRKFSPDGKYLYAIAPNYKVREGNGWKLNCND